jgi:hypothetical protein
VKILLLLLLTSSCARLNPSSGSPKEGRALYTYTDVSGSFTLSREKKLLGKKLVTRSQISQTGNATNRILEKSITVSQLGSIKGRKGRLLTLRPLAAEFTVWLEGKRYASTMKLNEKSRSMVLNLDSPEERWKGTQSIVFPRSQYFCFLSQIPECLYRTHLLELAKSDQQKKHQLFVVWESYPYTQEILQGVGQSLFSAATLKYDGVIKSHHRYSLEVDGQIILYDFSNSYDLVRIVWIAQGITVVPPGEETSQEDE